MDLLEPRGAPEAWRPPAWTQPVLAPRAPAGALRAGTGCVHAGGRRATGAPRGSGSSIVSSSSSGAGAEGLMLDDGSLCAGARAPRSPLPLAPEPPAGAAGTPRSRVSGTRHSPGTKVCLSEVTAARSRHPGQVHSIVTSCGNLHCPGMRLCSLSVRTRLRLHPMQVNRPPRIGAGLLPGGVGAGTPAGKCCEGHPRHPEVEGGVFALCALVGNVS